MTLQPQSHGAIARELARIRRRRRQPIHPGYVAVVAKAHELGLPKRATTDITLLDRRLIVQRRPRQFAWRVERVRQSTQHPRTKPAPA